MTRDISIFALIFSVAVSTALPATAQAKCPNGFWYDAKSRFCIAHGTNSRDVSTIRNSSVSSNLQRPKQVQQPMSFSDSLQSKNKNN